MTSRPQLVIRPQALRSRRLSALLTQEGLARKARVSEDTVRQAEDIKTGPKAVFPGTVKKLARALDCDPADISEVTAPEEVTA